MLNNYFDLILCISIQERADRRDNFDDQARKIGFKFEYFTGIQPEMGGQQSKERLGCLRSHKECLKIARERGAKNVLIMEDDCEFRAFMGELFEAGMDSKPEYDILYLGGSLFLLKGGKHKLKPSGPFFKEGDGILTTHSYAVPQHSYDELIELLEDESQPVDVRLLDFQQRKKCLIFKRNITRQLDGYSNIEKRKRTNQIFDN